MILSTNKHRYHKIHLKKSNTSCQVKFAKFWGDKAGWGAHPPSRKKNHVLQKSFSPQCLLT